MPQPWPALGRLGRAGENGRRLLRYKGTAKNTLAEPDPLKRLAPAGNGIVFRRALSGIVRGKTVSLMLLPTGQMVSEPRSRAAFVRGARSGGREGSCFQCPGYLPPAGPRSRGPWPARCARQQASRATGTPGTELNFHLVIALPGRQSSCAIVPLCNRGETCAGEMCHAHVCPAAEPRSLLPGDEWAMLTALSGPHPHPEAHQTHPMENVGVTRAQGRQAGCRDGPQRRRILGKSCLALLPQPLAHQHPGGQTAKLHHFPLQPRHLTRLL